jgi:hypothetical protein
MLDDTLQRESSCPGRIMLIKDPDQVPECLSLSPTSNDSDPAEQQAILDRIRSKSTQLRGLIFIGTRVMPQKPYLGECRLRLGVRPARQGASQMVLGERSVEGGRQ